MGNHGQTSASREFQQDIMRFINGEAPQYLESINEDSHLALRPKMKMI
jgi:hypothetical protein